MRNIKQVIIMRKDLGMNKGKCIAQGCHASLGAILASAEYMKWLSEDNSFNIKIKDNNVIEWLNNEFTKVTLSVNSEEELLNIRQMLIDANIVNVLITDSGHTVFNGIPTNTCIGVVPTENVIIDKITGHLKLF